MKITPDYFGTTSDGQPVIKFTLTDGDASVSVLTLGGIIQSLVVPDRNGNAVDVVLGFDDVQSYEKQNCYIGALLGRCANRIVGGDVVLGDQVIHLACNDRNICHLHGGNIGFDRKIWTPDRTEDGLTLSYCSPAGEEGYPGTMHVSVTYRLEKQALSLCYRAVCDRDTLCNLSNHAYFNLTGHASGSVDEQHIQILADTYTPLGGNGAPDGRIAPVAGTPLDLRDMHCFSEGWDMPFHQIALAQGYDHNYLCGGAGLRTVACACSGQTGIHLEVQTDMPGLQLYSGNYLTDLPAGKHGARYGVRSGFCLETQYPPNAVNCPAFSQPVLRAGEEYVHTTVYAFRVI